MLRQYIQEIQPIEQLIEQYKINKNKINKLTEENNKIKELIVNNYMVNSDTIENEKGMLLVAYKTSVRTTFQAKKLEQDNKELYNKYLDLIEVKTFLVK